MNGKIQWKLNDRARWEKGEKTDVGFLSPNVAGKAQRFHSSFPEYEVTPLWDLKQLALDWNVANILVKDESYRFGLNAFKVLGGAYALGRYICETTGMDPDEMEHKGLRSSEVKEKLGDVVFVTATDGNHGRGVAWAARQFGCRSVVFMPKGSASMRLENIQKEGALASITDFNYDDAVRYAMEYASKKQGVMIQDTAWEGYEDIPTWIMQGYTTIAAEIEMQLKQMQLLRPTHVFLQAGVGSYAAAIQGFLAACFGPDRPITVIVEPNAADCLYRSITIDDGEPHAVTGDMDTIMAGLACGEPNTIGWKVLRDYADWFFSCPDSVAARGMRILANPLPTDPKITSGESGAVGLGLLSILMERSDYADLRAEMKLDENARILLISTEGDTDQEGYRRVVWDGAHGYDPF